MATLRLLLSRSRPGAHRAAPLLLLAAALLFAACSDDNDSSPVDPAGSSSAMGLIRAVDVNSFTVPEFWVLGSDEPRTVQVTLDLPDAQRDAIHSGALRHPDVRLIIVPPGSDGPYAGPAWPVWMHDDGGAVELSGEAGFVASSSGDLIPGDLVYSARFSPGFAAIAGDYTFYFELLLTDDPWTVEPPDTSTSSTSADGLYDGQAELGSTMVRVTENAPPFIDGVGIPAELPSGFEPTQWTITAIDPDEPNSDDEVVSVRVDLRGPSNTTVREFLFAEGSGNDWTYAADSTFAAAIATGDYTMNITARDRFDQVSEPFAHDVFIENTAPDLQNLVMPDTAYQGESSDMPNVYQFTVEVDDRQGQGDIEIVYYSVQQPGSDDEVFDLTNLVFGDNGPEGNTGDEVAGDGIWTHTISVDDDVSNFGEYIFRVYADDRGGNTTEPLVETIVFRPNTEN